MRSMAFVTLFVAIVINLLLRVRIPPRTSGPLLDWRAFTEIPYIFFVLGFFLIYWAVYFAFYYVCFPLLSSVNTSTDIPVDGSLRFQLRQFQFSGLNKHPSHCQRHRYSRPYSTRIHRFPLARSTQHRHSYRSCCCCRLILLDWGGPFP